MSGKELDKIKLIYEFQKDSPLFARVAEANMSEGNLSTAQEILENGIQTYPDYICAKLVLIEVLSKKSDYKGVIRLIDQLRDKVDEETLNYYLDKTEEEREKKNEFEKTIHGSTENLEDNLENLADTLNNAKIPPAEDSSKSEQSTDYSPKGTQFISETLAEIYFSQSNYKEALEIYEKLLESNPANAEHYKSKIDEIKQQIK